MTTASSSSSSLACSSALWSLKILIFAGRLGAELLDQPDAVLVAVPLERPLAVRRPQVGDRDDVHVLRRMLREEDVPLIAGADERRLDRVPFSFP